MKNVIRSYKLFLILTVFWFLLTLNFSPLNLIMGTIISIVVTRASYGILYDNKGFIFKPLVILTLIKYFFNLLIEIYKSSFTYIVRIIKKDCDPFIVEIELDVTDPLIITIIANSITLTPGTITVDTDKNKLTVLTLKNCEDCAIMVEKEIKEKFQKFFVAKG